MKTFPLSIIFSLALLLALCEQPAHAQWILGVSSLTQNSTAHTIQGTSSTQMDYNTQLYYLVYVRGYIYNQDPNVRLASQEANGSNGTASVNPQVSNTTPGVTYNLRTEHYYWPIYPSCVFPGSCNKYDYYGYLYRTPEYSFVQNYGASHTFSNYGQYAEYSAPNYLWLGNTNTSITAAPALSITNSRVSGNLNGTTQNALLGSPAGLQASVSPTGISGNYVWALTGPFVFVESSQDNRYRSNYWTQPGTYAATVTYSGSGFSVSSTVNIQVRVPTLTSFSGTVPNTLVNRGSNCVDIFTGQYLPFGTTVSMGCSLLEDGMEYAATATIPNVAYLSNPADTGIIFKQIVSKYRKRNNRGRFECLSSRNPQSDSTTGWQPDAIAGEFYSPGVTFSNATTITHEESDLPASAVSGRQNVGGEAFEYEAFLADDRFETYVYYFTGDSGSPSFSIPLHVADAGCPADRFDCGVDLLAWRFGPQVHYDPSIQNSQYRLVADNTVGTIPLTRRPSVRSYSVQQTYQFSLCQGAPDVTNPIDGTRYYVLQLYWDVLNRTADQGGWDGWTTIIASCGFDTACINSNRIAVARGFLESAENFTNNPALANPGSHAYNREYVRLCYEAFLNRVPDPPGWDGWTNYINGHPGEYSNLVGGFINSSEYRGRFGTP